MHIYKQTAFLIKTGLSASQITERAEKVEKKEGRVFFLDQSSSGLKNYLKENHSFILSTGFSALVIAGRHFWGTDWSEIKAPTH